MRRTKEEAAATREQILDAALRVFSRKGYSAATLQDVAAEAGLTRGAVYWHFKGKVELYTALVSERFARANEVLAEALSPRYSPLESIERLLTRSLEYLEEDPEYRAVLSISLFKTELTPELEPGFQQKIASMRRLVDAVADLVRKGIAAGEIDRATDPRAAALAAVSLVNGATALHLMDPKVLDSKAAVRRMVATFVRGLRR
ncbi:TetR family transcriptional regulator [Sorangium sp. So ce1182]|uniref:TetR family transcriptional regulator n=1 Tax=Sorangium sp. So ce1182 TaxID=3133334 RepID=UPI003F5EE401